MGTKQTTHLSKRRQDRPAPPRVVGTGLVALDVVAVRDSSDDPKLYAGGTCGNVLAILGFLGWQPFPIARLDNGNAARHVVEDLQRWKVETSFLSLEPRAPAPIIVQWIKRDSDGSGTHRFSFTCPDCGAWYPTFMPVVAASIASVVDSIQEAQVFFFDRASRSSIQLAQHFRESGAIIYFEPSGIGEPRLFREAVEVAHVVKYASDRLTALVDLPDLPRSPLEIRTMGSAGLRFRSAFDGSKTRGWRRLRGCHAVSTKDSAGAGDWMSAVLLDELCRSGFEGVNKASVSDLMGSLSIAQAAAAWNCGFEGARAGMYEVKRTAFLEAIKAIGTGTELIDAKESLVSRRIPTVPSQLCGSCSSPKPSRKAARNHR